MKTFFAAIGLVWIWMALAADLECHAFSTSPQGRRTPRDSGRPTPLREHTLPGDSFENNNNDNNHPADANSSTLGVPPAMVTELKDLAVTVVTESIDLAVTMAMILIDLTVTVMAMPLKSKLALNSVAFSFAEELDGGDDPKAQLLREINNSGSGPPRFAAGDDEASKQRIAKLVDDLSGYVLPLQTDLPSEWRLIYQTAPDLLGVRGGPLSQLNEIKQVLVNANRLDMVLAYQPSAGMVGLLGSVLDGLADDTLEQTVSFAYAVGAMNKVDVKLTGTSIKASRLATLGGSDALPSLPTPTPLPLGGLSVIFNDGDLRIDRTVQGDFLLVYQRIRT